MHKQMDLLKDSFNEAHIKLMHHDNDLVELHEHFDFQIKRIDLCR